MFVGLAALQYLWLGQISEAERERLQTRLNSDADLFAADFNREIRVAYFIFQIDPNDWLKKDWSGFNVRYKLWRTQTAYPQLVKDFFFVGKDAAPLRYDAAAQSFNPTDATGELLEIKRKFLADQNANRVEPFVLDDYTMLMPNYAAGGVTGETAEGFSVAQLNLSGFVVIKLDEKTVEQMLDDLTARYFPPGESSPFDISISSRTDGKIIYPGNQNSPVSPEASDASVALFDLSSITFRMAVNNRVFAGGKAVDTKVVKAKDVSENQPVPMSKDDTVKVQMTDSPKTENPPAEKSGLWRLNARHADGSLERHVGVTRRKNLAAGLGILTLLAVSVALVFLSARRARLFAQRQTEFVAAVSHEFRTPLAVICSAGENLADGVTKEAGQVARYGDLIKREGDKISKMVERILDFAGADSGRKKYDFREINVEEMIAAAVAECQPLLDESAFEAEKNIAENLPVISADKIALGQAIQNLIVNAVKYSNGEKRLKISAESGDGRIKITVEDFGIGIAPKDLKHIFEPFYRAASVVDKQIHGNGLGLSLVKQTVEKHGGRITAKSEIGKGSRFIIELPCKNPIG